MSSISRRDFLNGVALTVAAGLTPAAQIAAEPARYTPALTGLRGQHPGSFEIAHAQARAGTRFALDRLPPGQGVVPFREVFGLLAAKGYRGYMSYEAPNPAAWTSAPASAAWPPRSSIAAPLDRPRAF